MEHHKLQTASFGLDVTSADRFRDGRAPHSLACGQELSVAEAEDDCSILSQMYSGGITLNKLGSGTLHEVVQSTLQTRNFDVISSFVFCFCCFQFV